MPVWIKSQIKILLNSDKFAETFAEKFPKFTNLKQFEFFTPIFPSDAEFLPILKSLSILKLESFLLCSKKKKSRKNRHSLTSHKDFSSLKVLESFKLLEKNV